MIKKEKIGFPKGFFNQPRKIISNKEALKDLNPVDWKYAIKDRKDTNNQVIKLVK